jgi:molybdopterin converting factor small subunit
VSIAATRGSSDDMSATINIHQSMRHLTDGRAVVEVRGDTVGECLEYLIDQYPDVKTKILDKKGELLNYIDLYVNAESSYPEELKRKVKEGDELTIALMLCGG